MGATNGCDGLNRRGAKAPRALVLFLAMACFELLSTGALARSPITTILSHLRSGVGAEHHSESTRFGSEPTHASYCTGANCAPNSGASGAAEATYELNSGASKNYPQPSSGGRSGSTALGPGKEACDQDGRRLNGALNLQRLRYGLFETNSQRRLDAIHVRLQIIIGGRQRHACEN